MGRKSKIIFLISSRLSRNSFKALSSSRKVPVFIQKLFTILGLKTTLPSTEQDRHEPWQFSFFLLPDLDNGKTNLSLLLQLYFFPNILQTAQIRHGYSLALPIFPPFHFSTCGIADLFGPLACSCLSFSGAATWFQIAPFRKTEYLPFYMKILLTCIECRRAFSSSPNGPPLQCARFAP